MALQPVLMRHSAAPMDARCFYGTFVNGILEHVGPRLDAAVWQQLARLGLDPAVPHEIYRASTFFAAIPILASALAPHAAPDAAERAFGAEVPAAYASSDAGRGLVGYFVQIGTLRTLLEAQAFFRSGCNFLQIQSIQLGPTRVRLRMRGTGGHPHFLCGILEGAYRYAGMTPVRALLVEASADAATIDADW